MCVCLSPPLQYGTLGVQSSGPMYSVDSVVDTQSVYPVILAGHKGGLVGLTLSVRIVWTVISC